MLRRARRERGSIDFDLPEARVLLGASGEPVDIQRVVRLESHRLVEDLMLLANELVAAEAARRKLPIPYRVHDGPNDKKLQALRDFLASLGHSLPKGSPRPRDLQAVLDRVRDRPEEKLVSSVVLRSMQRARYDPRNAGHFGLAAEHYAHFTSPIRRYPDLVLHRVVVRALIQGEDVPREWGGEELEAVAERSSIRERVADEAERESVELKKIEYMEGHLGDRFHGTVSGVTSFGFFVLLDEVFVEGLVHVNALHDDYYDFREEAYALVGNRTGRRFRLGDRVQVDVARADREQRHIDFILAES
jgi:ribonuclease R